MFFQVGQLFMHLLFRMDGGQNEDDHRRPLLPDLDSEY